MRQSIVSLKHHFALFIAMIILIGCLQAQQETYDIVTYTPPSRYVKEEKQGCIVYKFTNKKDKTWCQIAIYKNTASKGSIEADFDTEWQDIVANTFNVTDAPKKESVTEAEGWKFLSGSGKLVFNNNPAATILTTCTGYNARLSFLVVTNASRYLEDYEKLMASIDLYYPGKEPTKEEIKTNEGTTPTGGGDASAIEGVWIKSGSVNPAYGNPASWGMGGYSKDQYIFHTNGTYEFYSKSFGYSVTNLILTKEKGTITIQGNQITLTPKTSVVESWTKKDNTDNWGRLVSSEKRALETVTYTFTKHYFSGIQQWNLILQTSQPTNRDGSFGDNPNFANAYFYAAPANNNTAIELPK